MGALLALMWALPMAQSLQEPADMDWAGETLVAQYACLNCHRADDKVEQRIDTWPTPSLSDIGERVTPIGLMGMLTGVHGSRDSRMPDVMRSMSMDERIEVSGELIHFLYQQNGFEFQPLEVSTAMIDQGQRLFESVGCLPCHQDRLERRALFGKYSVASLRDMLRDSLKARPSGVMPDSRLSKAEATAIAAWLLRLQYDNSKVEQVPGLKYRYYENNEWAKSGEGLDWSKLEPREEGLASEIHHEYGSRRQNYGLVFEGYLEVPSDGEYFFATISDDGSNMWIGKEKVVQNWGDHAPKRVESQAVSLSAGRHLIKVTFYEAGGGEELQVEWRGPGFDWRTMAEQDLWHRGIAPMPMMYEAWELDQAAAERGRDWFGKLGCANCHDDMGVEPQRTAMAWEELPATQAGCVDPPRRGGSLDLSATDAPKYTMPDEHRQQLVNVLRNRAVLHQPIHAAGQVQRGMQRFQCLQCHTNGDVGGPAEELHQFFHSTDDLGDEGRFSPDIADAGLKFRADWLPGALADGMQIRSAMVTRMPAFGEQAKPLAQAISVSALTGGGTDADNTSAAAAFNAETAKAGHELVGVGGLSCIICHGAGGYPSIGVQGPDLSDMHQRLRPQWYRQWMEAPPAMRPGTRMPMFWFNGKSAVTHVLDGDMDAQIDAIWQYMSLGHAGQLPKGLVVDQSEYDLVPVDRPIYFGTFMKGLSARVLAVGFPQRVSLAFDQHNVRTGQIWQGDFMNAKGTWQGRAGQLEQPAGGKVHHLPAGMAVAILSDATEPWPSEFGKEAGWRYKGHSRNADGFPTFRYQFYGLQIEESWQPHVAPGAISLNRRFRVISTEPGLNIYLRVADAKLADEVKFQFPNQDSLPRFQGDAREILIPLTLVAEGDQYVAQTSYRMTW